MSASSFSASTGPVHNPFAKGWNSAGSSNGCGALVALGQADLGIGGDQGLSIRLPASWCGLYGLKPTFGLVPYTGIAPLGMFYMIWIPPHLSDRMQSLALTTLAP